MTDIREIIQTIQTRQMVVMGAMDGATVMVVKEGKEHLAVTVVMVETQGQPVAKVEKAAAEEMQQAMAVPEMGEVAVVAMMVVVMVAVAAMQKTGGVAMVVVAEMPQVIQEVATVAKVATHKREREEMVDAAVRLKRMAAVVMGVTVGMGDRLEKAALVVTQLVAQAIAAKEEGGLKLRPPSCQTTLITIPAWKTSRLRCHSQTSQWQT